MRYDSDFPSPLRPDETLTRRLAVFPGRLPGEIGVLNGTKTAGFRFLSWGIE